MSLRKKKIIFDIDNIVRVWKGYDIGTGIYYAAYNILQEMLIKKDLEVFITSGTEKREYLSYFGKREALKDFKYLIITDPKEHNIQRITRLKHKLMEGHGDSIFARAGIRIINSVFLPILAGASAFIWGRKISSFDIYFSPIYKVPDYIERNNRIKKFVFLHDINPLMMKDNISSFEDSWFMQLVRQINPQDNYFVNSEFTKKEFIRLVPSINKDKITVTHLAAGSGFQPDKDAARNRSIRGKYGIPQDKRYFLSLCTIEPRKNLIFAVRNFITFVREKNITDLVFVLSGGHWEQFSQEILKEISDFDNQNSIIIQTGYVDEEDLSSLYSNAECFVYVSKYEGFGLPPLEAMRCGTPVISSNAASLPEVVGDAGIMVDPQDDLALTEAYEKVYSDKRLREALSRKGIEQARKFSWEKCTDIMLESFKRAMDTKEFSEGNIINIPAQRARPYKLGTQLSFAGDEGRTGNMYCVSGFSTAEPSHTWTDGKMAKMKFNIEAEQKELVLEIEYYTFDEKQPVSVYVNNYPIADYTARGTERREFAISSKILAQDKNLSLLFVFPKARSPLSLGLGNDSRELALAMKHICIKNMKVEDQR